MGDEVMDREEIEVEDQTEPTDFKTEIQMYRLTIGIKDTLLSQQSKLIDQLLSEIETLKSLRSETKVDSAVPVQGFMLPSEIQKRAVEKILNLRVQKEKK